MTHQSQQPLDEKNAFGPLTSTQGISHIKQARTSWGREQQFCHLGGESHDVDLHIMIRSILCTALHAEQ